MLIVSAFQSSLHESCVNATDYTITTSACPNLTTNVSAEAKHLGCNAEENHMMTKSTKTTVVDWEVILRGVPVGCPALRKGTES